LRSASDTVIALTFAASAIVRSVGVRVTAFNMLDPFTVNGGLRRFGTLHRIKLLPSRPTHHLFSPMISARPSSPPLIQDDRSSLEQMVFEGFAFAEQQYSQMLAALPGDGFPRTVQENQPVVVPITDWTAGFFPGALWQLFAYTRKDDWALVAERYTERLRAIAYERGTHDVGFTLNCSFGNGYRLILRKDYLDTLVTGARSLATRFNPVVGAIRSWDHPNWAFPVIIDNMMNLELLVFAAAAIGDTQLRQVAEAHADTSLRDLFRADHSSYHLASFDPVTGKLHRQQTHQGYADASAWARGQTWGLYGYTMMYRSLGKPAYLDQARAIANFLINHPRLPADKVPYWDFDAPDMPTAPRDSSAAAISASALLELSCYVGEAESHAYLDCAIQQLRALSLPVYRPAVGSYGNFLLMHGTGHLPGSSEVDTALIYGDYYYLEALNRLDARLRPASPGTSIHGFTVSKRREASPAR
jgi:hypothetical protein